MSLGYAEKLSFKEDVGQVGMSEIFDSPRILQQKIEKLASLIKKSKHLVVFTGAGISTSCGIPDFRGPKGIWTLQKKGKVLPQASLPFHRAMPSMTHMALVELERANILKFVISQNVDGLHLRSGIPREKLSELHGNSFMEICPSCDSEYFRDFEVESIGLKETTRNCAKIDCRAKLKDTVLDWEDELPPKEMNQAEIHCKKADLVLCLGTSLQITPACDLPLKCLRGKGKIVIVNLQKTPKDKKASVVIRGFSDKVIAGVLELLNLRIPPFVRIDCCQIILTQEPNLDESYSKWTIQIASAHDLKAPLSFISSVEVSFDEGLNMKDGVLDKQPFQLERYHLYSLRGDNFAGTEPGFWLRTVALKHPFDIFLKINFSDGCGCECTIIKIPIDFQVREENYTCDKGMILEKLQRKATKKLSCGENEVIERKFIVSPKRQIITYAAVTNISVYDTASKVSEVAPKSKSNLKRQNESENGIVKSPKKNKII